MKNWKIKNRKKKQKTRKKKLKNLQPRSALKYCVWNIEDTKLLTLNKKHEKTHNRLKQQKFFFYFHRSIRSIINVKINKIAKNTIYIMNLNKTSKYRIIIYSSEFISSFDLSSNFNFKWYFKKNKKKMQKKFHWKTVWNLI